MYAQTFSIIYQISIYRITYYYQLKNVLVKYKYAYFSILNSEIQYQENDLAQGNIFAQLILFTYTVSYTQGNTCSTSFLIST